MAASLGDLKVNIGADTSGLKAAMAEIDRFNAKAESLGKAAGNFQAGQKKVQQAAKSTASTTDRAQSALLSLKSSLGGAERASAQYAKAQTKLQKAQEAGLVSQKEVARLQGQIQERFSTTATKARSVGDAMRKLKGAVTAAKAAFAAFAAAMAVKELTQFASGAVDAAAKLDRLSKRTGVSAENIQAFSKAAKQAGVDTDKARDAIAELNLRVGEARTEGGEAEKAFKRLGVALKDSSGNARSTSAILDETVNAISKMENPARQAAAASKVFGEEAGPQLVNALNKGTGGLDKYKKQLRESGALISNQVAAKTRKAQEAIGNFGDKIVKSLQVGTVKGFTNQFGNLQKQLSDPKTVKAFNQIGQAVGFVAGQLIKLIQKLPVVVEKGTQVASALKNTFVTARENVESFLNFFGTLPEKMTNIAKKTVQGVKEWFVGGFSSVVDSVRDKMDSVTGAFSSAYQSIVGGSIVPDLVNEVGAEFSRLDENMVKQAEDATQAVRDSFERNLSNLIEDSLAGQEVELGKFFSNIAATARRELSQAVAGAVTPYAGSAAAGGEGARLA